MEPRGGAVARLLPEEALTQRADRLLVSPDDRVRARELFAQVGTGARWAGVFPLLHRDGTERPVEFRTMRLRDSHGQPHLLGLAADATTVRGVERDLALSHSLVRQTPVGIAVFDTDLRWVAVNPALEHINGVPEEQVIGRRVGEVLPGLDVAAIESRMRHVLITGKPLLDQQTVGRTAADVVDRAYSESYHRIEDAQGRVLGLAMAVLDVTEREQAAAEVAQARQHLSVVAEAGVRIGTTLDLQQTARELADVAVPHVADLAAVDVLESVVTDGTITPVTEDAQVEFRALAVAVSYLTDAIHAADPVGELATYGPNRIITRCVREAGPILVERVDPPTMRRIARDGRAAQTLRTAGVHSYLAVPLMARGEVLGTLSLYRTVNERPFDEQDRVLASELAARAAICIDNARLYGRERTTALTLQRSLLPPAPAQQAGLDIAARYLPALSEVGGDWYDVLPLGPGRTGLVVGDVMGKGVQAAAIMGQLSTATRALARLDLPGRVAAPPRRPHRVPRRRHRHLRVRRRRPRARHLRTVQRRAPAARPDPPRRRGGAPRHPRRSPARRRRGGVRDRPSRLHHGRVARPVLRRSGGEPGRVHRRRTARADTAVAEFPPPPGADQRHAAQRAAPGARRRRGTPPGPRHRLTGQAPVVEPGRMIMRTVTVAHRRLKMPVNMAS